MLYPVLPPAIFEVLPPSPSPSPFSAATSAALLGSPISVGHNIIPAADILGKYGAAQLLAFLPGSGSGNLGVTRLLTQERGGEVTEFQIPPPQEQPLPEENAAPTSPSETAPAAPTTPVSPQPQENATPRKTNPLGAIELTADRQDYDEERQVIAAEGNVVIRFQQAVLNADRVDVNIKTRLAVAQGNVILTRGQQVLRGNRFEYYFVQDSGVILNASGEIYQRTALQDLSAPLPNDVGSAILPSQPLSDRLRTNQPLQQITNPGGVGIAIGDRRNIDGQPPIELGGSINRVRFEASRVDFAGINLLATNVRISNDPFSPPELELQADTARFTRISPLEDEITASRPRLVLDQNFSVPLFRDRLTLDRRARQPNLFNLGFDSTDRGGLFVESSFEPLKTPGLQFSLTPQYFIQRAVQEGKFFDPDVLGIAAKLNARLGANTDLRGSGILTSLDLNDIENNLRSSLRLRQVIGNNNPHTLNLEYSYRDRLFNGSLGFQTVQSSLGAVLTSPVIPLGQTGVSLSYQAGAQAIDAETDFLDLLKPDKGNNRVNLNRYQASASVSRGFLLLKGEALPPTPDEGLRYSPAPVSPYLQLNAGFTGVTTGYSSGDFQNSLSGNIGLSGQIGHFSRPFLDYTGFNITYSQIFPNGRSPFLFDRLVDTRVLSTGITQQVYGPVRAGFQTSLNLDNTRQISTDYFVEYSRRTYNLLLRYNPVVQIGSISFRLNGFNWLGNPEPFGGSEVRPVVQGVTR